jgi:hypothetical protein
MTKTGKLAFFATLAFACMLCFVLVGCGDNKANFTGDWTLDSMEDENIGTMSGDELATIGITIELKLNSDGTGTFNMLGESQDVTWEAKSATEMSATISNSNPATFQLQDSKLTSEEGTSKLVFKKQS